LAGLIGAAVSLAWFCFSTVSRISTLESQMQALVISRAANDSQPYLSSSQNVQTQSATGQSTKPIEMNPIMLVCADLAAKLYEKYKSKNGIPALEPITAVMDQLGCKGIK